MYTLNDVEALTETLDEILSEKISNRIWLLFLLSQVTEIGAY